MTVPDSTTIANLARRAVVRGWFPGGLTDQFVRKITFEGVTMPSEAIVWNRATSLPAVDFYAIPQTPFTATAMDTTAVIGSFRRLGDVAEVDTFQELAASDPNDQLQIQIEAKKAAAIRTLGAQIVQSNGGGANLQGLPTYMPIPGPQARDAGGVDLTLDLLHRLVTMVTASDGCVGAGADCLVANEQVVREVIHLGEEAHGGAICYEWDEDLGVRVPHFPRQASLHRPRANRAAQDLGGQASRSDGGTGPPRERFVQGVRASGRAGTPAAEHLQERRVRGRFLHAPRPGGRVPGLAPQLYRHGAGMRTGITIRSKVYADAGSGLRSKAWTDCGCETTSGADSPAYTSTMPPSAAATRESVMDSVVWPEGELPSEYEPRAMSSLGAFADRPAPYMSSGSPYRVSGCAECHARELGHHSEGRSALSPDGPDSDPTMPGDWIAHHHISHLDTACRASGRPADWSVTIPRNFTNHDEVRTSVGGAYYYRSAITGRAQCDWFTVDVYVANHSNSIQCYGPLNEDCWKKNRGFVVQVHPENLPGSTNATVGAGTASITPKLSVPGSALDCAQFQLRVRVLRREGPPATPLFSLVCAVDYAGTWTAGSRAIPCKRTIIDSFKSGPESVLGPYKYSAQYGHFFTKYRILAQCLLRGTAQRVAIWISDPRVST